MRGTVARIIALRELLDTVRDRRTLLLMLGMPLILYPGLILLTLQLGIAHLDELDRIEPTIVLTGPGSAQVVPWLTPETGYEIAETELPTVALLRGDIDAVVEVPGGLEGALEGDETGLIRILYDGANVRSRTVAQRLERTLDGVSGELRRARLERVGLPESFVEPLDVSREDAAPPERSTGFLIGSILPLALVMMITLGAFYPAVDLTAGEKERGTFETLLSTPITKLEIVTGKFMAVLGIALLVGVLNLFSMMATLYFVFLQMPADIQGAFPLDVEFQLFSLAVLLLAIVPLALFVAALMMAVAVFARSFKEGSNYATPVLFAILVLAVYGEAPGTRLEGLSPYIPITNVVLLCKELLLGQAAGAAVAAVLLSTAVWALLAVLLAAWIFQREEVVLADEGGPGLTLRRSQFTPRDFPSAGLAFALFAAVMLLLFYAGALLQQWALLPGIFLTQVLVVLAPTLALCWFLRIRLRTALNLHGTTVGAVGGAALAGVGTSLLAIQVAFWQSRVVSVPEGLREVMTGLTEGGEGIGYFLLIIAILAVTPAICEELLFRGAILKGLRTRLKPVAAILVCGLLFGLFHISLFRIFPTAILGVYLAWVAYRSRSVFPAMAAHFVHNGISLCLAFGYLPAFLAARLALEDVEEQGLPYPALLAGAVLVAFGMVLLHRSSRSR